SFFSYTSPPPTALYTLSLHDALPILDPPRHSRDADLLQAAQRAKSGKAAHLGGDQAQSQGDHPLRLRAARRAGAVLHLHHLRVRDRKSTRLNSSHVKISYAVFCLKKK